MRTLLIFLLTVGSTLAQITPAPTPPVITNDCVVIATEVYGRVGNASWREIMLFRYVDADFTKDRRRPKINYLGHAVAVWQPMPGGAIYAYINTSIGTTELGEPGGTPGAVLTPISALQFIAMAIQQKVSPVDGHAFFVTDAHFASNPDEVWKRPPDELLAWLKSLLAKK